MNVVRALPKEARDDDQICTDSRPRIGRVGVWATKGDLVTNISGSKGLLSGRLGLLIVAVAVTGLLAFAAWLFMFIGNGGYTWRHEVGVDDARLTSPDKLELAVGTCNKNPEVTLLRETGADVQVRVVADSHPFLQGGADCQDPLEVQLQEPLGDRIVVDKHTGRLVRVTPVRPTSQQEQASESGNRYTVAG